MSNMKFHCLWRKSNVLAVQVSDIYVFVFVNWLILLYILEIMAKIALHL